MKFKIINKNIISTIRVSPLTDPIQHLSIPYARHDKIEYFKNSLGTYFAKFTYIGDNDQRSVRLYVWRAEKKYWLFKENINPEKPIEFLVK